MDDMRRSEDPGAYWSQPAADLLSSLGSRGEGLGSAEAASRLARFGRNTIDRKGMPSALTMLLRQFRSPLVLVLAFAAIVSAFVGEGSEAVIIGVIIAASCVLSFMQEYGA